MPVRRKQYYRVSLGRHHKYFSDERDAREYQRDRSRDDDELRGIPFLEVIDERELLVILNNLSAMEQ
jgi:hypothetical protein